MDGNPEITSKKGLFTKVYAENYKGIVEYRPNMVVTEIDAASKTAITEVGDKVKGDVLNVIPPQRAAELARQAGVVNANNRWCQVDWVTMESTRVQTALARREFLRLELMSAQKASGEVRSAACGEVS